MLPGCQSQSKASECGIFLVSAFSVRSTAVKTCTFTHITRLPLQYYCLCFWTLRYLLRKSEGQSYVPCIFTYFPLPVWIQFHFSQLEDLSFSFSSFPLCDDFFFSWHTLIINSYKVVIISQCRQGSDQSNCHVCCEYSSLYSVRNVQNLLSFNKPPDLSMTDAMLEAPFWT